MTNLERAAALAAERGWPLVEVYRGWPVYHEDYQDFRYGGFVPHEIDWNQFWLVFAEASGKSPYPTAAEKWGWPPVLGERTMRAARTAIDAFEAAREAMPATAFFGVEEEALL